MMRIARLAAAAILAVSAPLAVLAHGDMTPRHGGKVALDGEIQIEAVATAAGLALYVTEEGLSVPVADLTGRAWIKGSDETQTDLAAVADTYLVASGLAPGAGDEVSVVLINRNSGLRSFATYSY